MANCTVSCVPDTLALLDASDTEHALFCNVPDAPAAPDTHAVAASFSR